MALLETQSDAEIPLFNSMWSFLIPRALQVLDGSSVRMIKTFVQASSGEGASSGNTSLTVQFRAQLEKLMQTLGQSPSFVKCIKPRDVISGHHLLFIFLMYLFLARLSPLTPPSGSNAFDSTKVLMQLVSSGVIETQVRLRSLVLPPATQSSILYDFRLIREFSVCEHRAGTFA
jgi:hypothetical protein